MRRPWPRNGSSTYVQPRPTGNKWQVFTPLTAAYWSVGCGQDEFTGESALACSSGRGCLGAEAGIVRTDRGNRRGLPSTRLWR